MLKLYWAESTISSFAHQGIVYKDVPFLWIVIGRENRSHYDQLILNYHKLKPEEKKNVEAFMNELLTEDEIFLLQSYIYTKFNTNIIAQEHVTPIDTRNRRPTKDINIDNTIGLFKLAEQDDYHLPFAIWGHYSVANLQTVEQSDLSLPPVENTGPLIQRQDDRTPHKKRTNQQLKISINDRFLKIREINFYGECDISENGRYILGWNDIYNNDTYNNGKYLLIEDEVIIIEGELERPNDGKVANNGNFILHDWMFGKGLQGIFYAFDKTGVKLISRTFDANLSQNSISNNGSFAACRTTHSKGNDSSTISFFDLDKGRILWQTHDISIVYSFEINTDDGFIYLAHKDISKLRFDFDGNFLDEQLWLDTQMKMGYHLSSATRRTLGNHVKNLSVHEVEAVLKSLKTAADHLQAYPERLANVYRNIGEIQEIIGRKQEAIDSYTCALKSNPDIGVRSKLQRLKQSDDSLQKALRRAVSKKKISRNTYTAMERVIKSGAYARAQGRRYTVNGTPFSIFLIELHRPDAGLLNFMDGIGVKCIAELRAAFPQPVTL